MRTLVALLACGTELFLWAAFSSAMGWRRMGGVLPMFILFSIVVATWKAIRGDSETEADSPEDQVLESPVPPAPQFSPVVPMDAGVAAATAGPSTAPVNEPFQAELPATDHAGQRLSVWRLPWWLLPLFVLGTWYRTGPDDMTTAFEMVAGASLGAIVLAVLLAWMFGALLRSQRIASFVFVVVLASVFGVQEAGHRKWLHSLKDNDKPAESGRDRVVAEESSGNPTLDPQRETMPNELRSLEPQASPAPKLPPLGTESSSRVQVPNDDVPRTFLKRAPLEGEKRTVVTTGGVKLSIAVPTDYVDVSDTAVQLFDEHRRLLPDSNRLLALLVPEKTTRIDGWPSVSADDIEDLVSIQVVRGLEYEVITVEWFDRLMTRLEKQPRGLPKSVQRQLQQQLAAEGLRAGLEMKCLFDETRTELRRAGRRSAVSTIVYPVVVTDPSQPMKKPLKFWQGIVTAAIQVRQKIVYVALPWRESGDTNRAETLVRWFVTDLTGWQPRGNSPRLVPTFTRDGIARAGGAAWSTIDVEQFGTMRIPHQLEVQHGQQAEVLKQFNKRLKRVNQLESRVVIQPRGMSRFDPDALKLYFRLIVETEAVKKGDTLDLSELGSATAAELAQARIMLKNEISEVMGSALLEMSRLDFQRIDGRPSLHWFIKRRSTKPGNPPVIVHHYWVTNGPRMHRIQVAWRVSEAGRWRPLLPGLIAGMRIVDKPAAAPRPVADDGPSQGLSDYKLQARRIIEGMVSEDRDKLPARDRAFLKFFEGLTAEALSATTKNSTASDRLDELAFKHYDEAILIDPTLPEAYVARGVLLLNNHNKHDKAIADFTQAIRLRPSYSKAYYHRADTYRDKSDSTNAMKDLGQAIRHNPAFGAAYFMRANFYKSMNRLELYRRDLQQSRQLRYESTSSYPTFLTP